MKILVTGPTGMLGQYMVKYLSNFYEVIPINRNTIDAAEITEADLSLYLKHTTSPGDIIINCAGTIKPRVDELGELNAIKVNSVFPRILANACEDNSLRMIHISTDCTYIGSKGNYNERDAHDVTDIYGRTKSLGEPKNCTVIRTSIIGEEVNQGRSLIEWVKSQKNGNANGYTNHIWNGVTCLQLAKVIKTMIDKDITWKGVRHIHSPSKVNKFTLLSMINDAYDLGICIMGQETPVMCDRSLSSIYPVEFVIPELKEQIIEQKEFKLRD